MQKAMCCGLLVMGLAGAAAFGQTAPAAAGDATAMSPRQMPSADKIVAMMATKLNLTAEQQQRLTPIVAARQAQMQAIRADTSARPMQRMKKAKAATEEADKQINAILTPEQQKQYAAMEAERKEEMKERRDEQKSGTN